MCSVQQLPQVLITMVVLGVHSAFCSPLPDHGQWPHGVVAANGAIYGIPGSATKVLKVESGSRRVSTFGSLANGVHKWSLGLATPGGMIYGVPFACNSVLRIDIYSDSVSTIGDFGPGCCKWRFALLAAGRIYGIPYSASSVLRIDPFSNTATLVGHLPSAPSKWLAAAVASNGVIYGVPFNAASVLKIEPSNDEVSAFGNFGDALGKWSACTIGPDGKIYGIPAAADRVIVIDPLNDRTDQIGPSFGIDSNKWSVAIPGAGGTIIGLPDTAAGLLLIDVWQRKVETLGSLGPGGLKWRAAAASPFGIVFAPPYLAGAILRADPASRKLALLGDFDRESGMWGAVVETSSGVIFCIPDSANTVIKIDTSTGTITSVGAVGGGMGKWSEAFLLDDGVIYALPATSNGVLSIDTCCDIIDVLHVPGLAVFSGSPDSGLAKSSEPTTDVPTLAPALAFCMDFPCTVGSVRRAHADELVCRRMPCNSTCCIQVTNRGLANVLFLPFAILFTFAVMCALRQLIRCKIEGLIGDHKVKMCYFTLMFVWDVFDQATSWWFWSYTLDLGASVGVQYAAFLSASTGMVVIAVALLAGLCLKTQILIEGRWLDFAYSVGVALSDVIMLLAVYAFEMEGLDESSLVKTLNLITTIIDFALKIFQAAWAFCGVEHAAARDGDIGGTGPWDLIE
mmetsp:Transcript_18346/g.52454  ORF Transcript_18346/g.52454 Transcript_18346/m.52454 type:complete len:681 (+) Transcript_18346:94-2136(+)